ncbi:ureide permease 1 isoform X4 [Physcomitrium patens]|uniref:ureide permease 1 isoform X4 n=1 Tax=Physcomitrium patens TaxID=3218 RepID=UPI000D16E543|nr:ureide permease 1-like isoform X4 [Physcomitrium patens]|eukprot:XP_024375280.1 ureide permease 1-like isoform X4 [Physcomitrella patens]
MACDYELGGEKGPPSGAHLLRLQHHQFPGWFIDCSHLGPDWQQHARTAQFHHPAASGQLAISWVCVGWWAGALHGQLGVPVCMAVRGALRYRSGLCKHHGCGRNHHELFFRRSDQSSGGFVSRCGLFLDSCVVRGMAAQVQLCRQCCKAASSSQSSVMQHRIGTNSEPDPESVVRDSDFIAEEPVKALPGSGAYLQQLEEQRALKSSGASTIFGLAIVVFAGICFSLFSPAFNIATNDQWHMLKPGVPHLVVYTAFFWFSLSAFVGAMSINIFFMYHPILGLKKTSFKAYISDWNGRKWAFLAGFLCGLGNGLQFMGGQAAGYAAADAVQALPLVSTFWGILVFKEYYRSSRRTYVLLVAMLVMFSAAVGILAGSAGHRKAD